MPELLTPPSRGTVRTLARILPFVRPYLARTVTSLFVYVALTMVSVMPVRSNTK